MTLPSAGTAPEKRRGPIPATTTKDAKDNNNPYLCLSSLKLVNFPAGITELKHLTHLDLSNNKITCIPEGVLPRGLTELTLTGNHLTELPSDIAKLTNLRKIFAGANRLVGGVDCVFLCPGLQHAGLAYNRLAVLPPGEVLSRSQLLSLDVAHNDLEGLMPTLSSLACIRPLSALCLGGNPLALSPRYAAEARARLGARLLYLDGQRIEQPSSSRPGTNGNGEAADGPTGVRVLAVPPAAVAARSFASISLHRSHHHHPHHTGGGLGSMQGVHFEDSDIDNTLAEVVISGIGPAADPYAWLRERWAAQIAEAEAAAATVPPALHVPVPPLQPTYYHVEMTDNEGVPLASIPLKLLPPTPPDVAALFDPKAKAAAAAAAAKEAKTAKKPPSARPGGSARGKTARAKAAEAAAGVERELETGLLRVVLPVCPTTADRNWLRNGTPVTLYRTTLTAVPRPGTAATDGGGAPPKTPTKGAAKKKKGDEPPAVEYDITSSTEVIGTAMLKAGGGVVDGYTTESEERLAFAPPPALFDERGVRLALADPRHSKEVVGQADAVVRLHVIPPGLDGAG